MPLLNNLSLGQRLRRERERLNWSQERLAEAVGTTARSINRWEQDKVIPHPHFRALLCRVLNVSADALFGSPDSVLAQPLIWNVPARRNPLFTGREDVLEALARALHTETENSVDPIQAQAISGLGGTGKTQIAIEYAYRCREDYQAVLWVRAETRELFLADLTALAALLQLPERHEYDQRVMVEAVKRWLGSHDRWLLIVDNVEDVIMVADLLPSMPRCHMILTTRLQATGSIAQRINVTPMGHDESMLFLLRRAKLLGQQKALETASEEMRCEAERIWQLVDGLPLALDQAGAYIEETGCSLAEYLDHYQTRRAALLNRRGNVAVDHRESVNTTFSLCLEKVQQHNPAAVELLKFCAFLHSDAIFEDLIIKGASELGPVLQSTILDRLAFDAVIEDLRMFSLVQRNPETKTLTTHRLVQVVIKDGMGENDRRRWAERAVRVVNALFPQDGSAGWTQAQQYLPHALTCVALITDWKLISPEAARLLRQTGHAACDQGNFSQAESLIQQAVAVGEQAFGPTHPDVVESLIALAMLSLTQGNYQQSEVFFQRAICIYEQHIESSPLQAAQHLNALGIISYYQGHYAQAEAYFQQALSIRVNALSPNHLAIASSLNNMGTTLMAQENHVQAQHLLQRALSIYEQTLEPGHIEIASSLNKLGLVFYYQDRYAQAELLFQRALSIRENALGPKSTFVAEILTNRANLYLAQGRLRQAEHECQRAFAIYQKLWGGKRHLAVARIFFTLAKLSHYQGNNEQSESYFQQARAIRLAIQGPDHAEVARDLREWSRLRETFSQASRGTGGETRS